MPKWMTVAFALFLSLQVFSTEGKNVDEVINNYVQAMGGKAKLHSIHSVYMEGYILQNSGNVNFSIYKLNGKLFHAEISAQGNSIFVFDANRGWKSSQSQTGSIPVELITMLQNDEADGPLVDYAQKGHKAELVGREIVAGRDCYKLKLTLHSEQEIDYYIDAANWLVVRKAGEETLLSGSQHASDIETSRSSQDYSNYRQTKNGYLFAYTIAAGTQGTTLECEKIEVNNPVRDELYKP